MVSTEYIPLAEREKVLIDLKGYLLFPAVLSAEELAPLKEQCEKLRQDKESLPPAERKLPGGAASVLIDHPAVMRVLHQIIHEETEKLRCESCFLSYRYRDDGHKGWDPDAGGKSVNPNHSYQYHDGKIHSGMTRVVWELNGVEKDKGGTAFPRHPQVELSQETQSLGRAGFGDLGKLQLSARLVADFSRGGAAHLVSVGAGRSAHGALFLL